MTLQARETFYYNGDELGSFDTPLSTHPKPPKFEPLGSFCWRGYRGTWSIRDRRLYLVDLYAHIKKLKGIPNYRYIRYDRRRKDIYYEIHIEPTCQPVYIEDVFPKMKDGKLFAYWFSGDVIFGLGEVTGHGMTCSYKKYLSLTFEHGVLVKEQIRPHAEIYPPKSIEEMLASIKSIK